MQRFTKTQDRPFGRFHWRRRSPAPAKNGNARHTGVAGFGAQRLAGRIKGDRPLLADAGEIYLVALPDANQEISVILTLPLGDSQGATAFVQHVATPGDPLFRKYITPSEFAARFGANAK